eukprot:CAMPEP_0185726300 /NCGR_PEP_ID=MMETSP1171-20130828/2325_1 /TAXON_ID=374046 /ORGANISM="Helicotheca tamensis, Strain CCMP826" /LENGTH=186 /DNA_ID=CAMNT_0028394625 /DNA_START=125 /DNA_END=681 /DNA_ORIENTATION=+
MGSPFQLFTLVVILVVATTTLLPTTFAFSPAAKTLHRRLQQQQYQRYAILTSLRSTSKDDDSDSDSDDGYFPLDDSDGGDFIFSTPSLGINIGAELGPLTPEEAAQIKAEASAMIEETFATRLDEIENVKKVTRKQLEDDAKSFAMDSEARAAAATDALMNKIDKMSDEFLEKNEALRMGTKMAAL